MSSSPRAHSRLQSLRTRRMLEDTAIAAAGGGHLASLAPDNDNPERWRAEVLTGARGRLVLLLDPRMKTVTIRGAGEERRAA